MRQNETRNELNSQKKSAVRTAEKKIVKAVEIKNWEDADSAYTKFSSLIDKAAKTNLFHKNKAARKKSRLAKFIAGAKKETSPS